MLSRPFSAVLGLILLSGGVGYFGISFSLLSRHPFGLPAVLRPHQELIENHLHGPDVSQEMSSLAIFSPNERASETIINKHGAGFTVFDRLYALNGTFFIVSSNPDEMPPLREIMSNGLEYTYSLEERLPTSKDIQIITPRQASEFFGPHVTRIKGVSFALSDPWHFLPHYYHFIAEVFLGLWRAYSSLDTSINEFGETFLPPPSRFMLINCDWQAWLDKAGLNEHVLRTIFPSIAIEAADDWKFKAATGRPYLFDRLVLGDRTASGYLPPTAPYRTVAGSTFELPGNSNWWLPIRTNLMESIGLDPKVGMDIKATPVITYIDRQGTPRRLKQEDHEGLVRALRELERTRGYEVNIVQMEHMSKDDQLRLACRSTIIMGVHGNGLTAVLWMYPTVRSALFEFMIPEGYANDYAWSARHVGVPHYGFWGTRYFNASSAPKEVNVPDGFHGTSIPIDGELVASLADAILSRKEV